MSAKARSRRFGALSQIGISEARFIRETQATFKQGIRFVDWVRPAGPNCAISAGAIRAPRKRREFAMLRAVSQHSIRDLPAHRDLVEELSGTRTAQRATA